MPDTPKPFVFISSAPADEVWRAGLREELSRLAIDSSPSRKEISGLDFSVDAMNRTRAVVLLLSPEYFSSQMVSIEFSHLTDIPKSELPLLVVIVRDCPWRSMSQLANREVWADGAPLSDGDETDLNRGAAELQRIAARVAELAGQPRPQGSSADASGKQVPPFSLRLSRRALSVVDRAQDLARKSGRDRVTRGSLLFAFAESAENGFDSAMFVRDVLDRQGSYAAVFARFLDTASTETEPEPDWELAEQIARWTAKPPEIHQRHLLAALIAAPAADTDRWLAAFAIERAVLCRDFRDFVGKQAGGDDPAAWDKFLIFNVQYAEPAPTSRGEPHYETGPVPSSTAAMPSESAAEIAHESEPYVAGPAGYTPEFCGVGGTHEVADQLGVEPLANRIAELIALRSTQLPLAVGLFGNWGSGKSHFMNLVDRGIEKLARETPKDWARHGAAVAHVDPEKGPWCREIVPIYFNAWHYLDSNLWASLVTEIFDGLCAHLRPKQDELALMRVKLRDAGGATARAEEEATAAEAAVRNATTVLEDARARSESARKTVRVLLDDLRNLLPQLNTEEEAKKISALLGVDAQVATLSQLIDKRREMASLPGRLRAIWQRATAPEGLGRRVCWLAAAAAGAFVVFLVKAAVDGNPSLVSPIQVAFSTVAGVAGWLLPAFQEVQRRLGQMESLQDQAEKAQAARPQDARVVAAQRALVGAEAAAATAEARLAEARTMEKQLTDAVAELSPERRLSRFIETRARSADYRGQLGLISLARRDFQELSDIFADAAALKRKMDHLPPDEAAQLARLGASIDRIVLFVDDLDRCAPEKVVDVLQAVHLLLAYPLFAVVVGVDQRCLRQSLRMQFRGLLTPDGAEPEAARAFGDEEQRPATPLDYLEKIFHVPLHLPVMDEAGYTALMHELTEPPAEVPREGDTTSAMPPRAAPVVTAVGADRTGVGDDRTAVGATVVLGATAAPGIGRDAGASSGGGAATDESAATERRTIHTIGSVPLQPWERKAIGAYHPLIRTPRGAKRLLNTYRLVRAGLPAEEWPSFRDDEGGPSEYRVAMLLLALAAGHPAVARQWFERFRRDDPALVFQSAIEGSDGPAWRQFKSVYDATCGRSTPGPSQQLFVKWIDRVERFAF